MRKTIITAHSGCEGTGMNSMEHIRTGLTCGADMIEIDIREKDGALYLSHDESDPAACVSFGTFLGELAKAPGIRVNCDVKTDGLAEAVMREASARGLTDRIVFTGSCMGEEEPIGKLGGEFWYSIWDPADYAPALRSMADSGAKVLNMPYRFATEESVKEAASLGLSFSCWTANDEAEIRRLLALGVYNITTRRPVLALRLRAELEARES